MFVAVRMLYCEGIMVKATSPRVFGQLISDRQRDVSVLHLHRLEWVHNAIEASPPLATLWQPVLAGIGHCDIVIRGLEGVVKGPVRRRTTQKWLSDVLDARQARDYFSSPLRRGEPPSVMPPSPPPADPDNPFA